ncbi:hypothetical protein IWW50_003915 [Coemansia erecta]|nr:hypothetical protein IWW50_003915 [Coemansia erecta]
MDSAPGAAVTALAAVLAELEDQQHVLLGRLRHAREELAKGGPSDELLATLSYYVNQAKHIQRRMALVRGRCGDLRRRADRLREHRAEQSQQVAEWTRQERVRVVPEALYSSSSNNRALMDAQPASQPASPQLECGAEKGVLSFLSPLRISTSLGGWASESEADRRVGQGSPASSVRSRAATPQPAVPGSPALSTASTLDSTMVVGSVPIATVKRKGKRRVRVPKIE